MRLNRLELGRDPGRIGSKHHRLCHAHLESEAPGESGGCTARLLFREELAPGREWEVASKIEPERLGEVVEEVAAQGPGCRADERDRLVCRHASPRVGPEQARQAHIAGM